jgi:hypothetical protein
MMLRQQQAKSWELRAAMSIARLWRDQAGRLAIFFDPAADRIEDRLNYPVFMASAAHNILRIWYTGVKRDCVATAANASAAAASDGWRIAPA